MIKGRLKAWNEQKGFGFISSEATERDVFVHISALKFMRRKPKVGDIIYFNIEQLADGKIRAINCEVEGVTPLEKQQPDSSISPDAKPKIPVLSFVLFCAIGVFAYQKWGVNLMHTATKNHVYAESLEPSLIEKSSVSFVCDGRIHCSQMTSRAEAEFFLENCPDTLMDGDNDHIPCENDSRF